MNRCSRSQKFGQNTNVASFSSPLAADWKYRHAGLMALSAIGEGCHQQMEAILEEIVKSVLDFCSDAVEGRGGVQVNGFS